MFYLSTPPNLYADGSLRIAFRQNGQGNVVVSEVWLWEAGEGSAKDVKAQAAEAPKEEKAPPAADKPAPAPAAKPVATKSVPAPAPVAAPVKP